jgi:hypothetical protein
MSKRRCNRVSKRKPPLHKPIPAPIPRKPFIALTWPTVGGRKPSPLVAMMAVINHGSECEECGAETGGTHVNLCVAADPGYAEWIAGES